MSSQRINCLDALTQNSDFDVVVVGGGINGIGVFRELALQGLRVLLVERNDFCSGCSAAPSRMIHGGLRYLENGEFDLVRESLAERDALLKNAPHFVRPLPTTIPIPSVFSGTLNAMTTFFGWSGTPARRGALPIKLGLSLYDWVTRKRRSLPKHQFRSAKATRKQWPQLTKDLRYTATYFDAWISYPERLGLDLILDTERGNSNSVALNYAEIKSGISGYSIVDKRSGKIFEVTTKTIVNATGAWLDETIDLIEPNVTHSERLVSGTKGSHLILESAELVQALNGHMIYFENDDGRICIVFPYLGKVLVGSTDIRVEAASRVGCEPEERDYILQSLRRVFPRIVISTDQILFSYSGIRPLPKSDQDFTGRISRGHFTKRLDGKVPQFCMVGGKWTTFRAFAQQTADEVLRELGIERRTDTQNLAIGGGAEKSGNGVMASQKLSEVCEIHLDRAEHLINHYGPRAQDVQRFCVNRDDDQPIGSTSSYTFAEISFLMKHEHVETLSDVVFRRTDLAITGQISMGLIDSLAQVMARELKWSEKRTQEERQTLIAELEKFHSVSGDMLQKRNEKGN